MSTQLSCIRDSGSIIIVGVLALMILIPSLLLPKTSITILSNVNNISINLDVRSIVFICGKNVSIRLESNFTRFNLRLNSTCVEVKYRYPMITLYDRKLMYILCPDCVMHVHGVNMTIIVIDLYVPPYLENIFS